MTTIRDIAKISGVSYPTVSHVLNRTRNVSIKTQKKVFDAINELGYVPNAVARGFSRKRMNSIGVVATKRVHSLIEDHCHGPIIEAALISAQDYDQVGMLHFAKTFPDDPSRVSLYCDGRSDGIILVGQPTNTELVSVLMKRNFPFVCVTEAEVGSDVPYVDIDQVGMAEQLANYLLELGHRSFLIVRGPDNQYNVQQRSEGFFTAFSKWRIPYKDVVELQGEYNQDLAYGLTKTFLRQTNQHSWPTAVICMNDFLAAGVLDALKELNITCPEQISVVGIDDAWIAATSIPPLTSMRLPLKEIGQSAVRILMSIINGDDTSPRQLNLPSKLIVRQSAAPPRR